MPCLRGMWGPEVMLSSFPSPPEDAAGIRAVGRGDLIAPIWMLRSALPTPGWWLSLHPLLVGRWMEHGINIKSMPPPHSLQPHWATLRPLTPSLPSEASSAGAELQMGPAQHCQGAAGTSLHLRAHHPPVQAGPATGVGKDSTAVAVGMRDTSFGCSVCTRQAVLGCWVCVHVHAASSRVCKHADTCRHVHRGKAG